MRCKPAHAILPGKEKPSLSLGFRMNQEAAG
jgi:hypothetical protein